MKAAVTLLLLLGFLAGVGCQEGAAPSPAPAPATPQTTETGNTSYSLVDCQILTVEEVSSICGIELNYEERGPQPELETCRGFYKKYKKSLSGSLGIAYMLLDPAPAIEACISPPQSDNPNIAPPEKGTPILDGRGCLSGDKQHVKIATKEYVIHIWNYSETDPLCSPEQLIQIAEIIAERVPLE